MQLYEVTSEEYAQAGFNAHVYNTPEFSELNKTKTNGLHYILIKDNKTRFSIVLGEKATACAVRSLPHTAVST